MILIKNKIINKLNNIKYIFLSILKILVMPQYSLIFAILHLTDFQHFKVVLIIMKSLNQLLIVFT